MVTVRYEIVMQQRQSLSIKSEIIRIHELCLMFQRHTAILREILIPRNIKLTHPIYIHIYRCPRRNVPDFGRVFLMLKYTDITQNNYIQIVDMDRTLSIKLIYFPASALY